LDLKGATSKEKDGRGREGGKDWKETAQGEGERGKEEGKWREGVNIGWPDLQLSLRDATAAASGPIWS